MGGGDLVPSLPPNELTYSVFTYDKIYLTVLRFKFTQDLHLTIV